MSKKFVNKAEEAVDDALFGLVSSNSNVKFHKSCRRVVHITDLNPSHHVSLIAGGGSGHEPYAAGYVGKGLLTAAIAGNVFASPPSRNVQAALEATRGEAGAILFVINYTGDRLNFGLAAERFNASGGTARVVTIADDVAIDSPNSKVGRRGLAGAVLTIKIAGAMAWEGKSLDEIYETSQKVVSSMGTLGVSLYTGSLPGKNRETELPDDQIEVGLGIHGEPGKFRAQFGSANRIVHSLLDTLRSKMEMREGEKFVVLVNNLGSVSQLEMNIVNGEVLRYFEDHKIGITRFFSGIYMTSLDGHGVSVTILRADDSMLQYLDAPAAAPGWIPALSVQKCVDHQEISDSSSQGDLISEIPASGVTVNAQLVEACVGGVVDAMLESEKHLNQLDAYAGDGDCGSTFAGAAEAIRKQTSGLNYTHPETLLKQLSIIFEQTVGGTSGALYALMFSSAAQSFAQRSQRGEKIDRTSILEALDKANRAVQKYGGARVGDRTMVDGLDAMVEELRKGFSGNEESLDAIFEAAVKASEKAAKATASQTATVGRASYTSSEAQTKPDAGATAISLWLRACWTAYKSEK